MKKLTLWSLVTMLILASMVFAACAPAAVRMSVRCRPRAADAAMTRKPLKTLDDLAALFAEVQSDSSDQPAEATAQRSI